MIKIIPDKEGKLTQWDLNRKVIVTGYEGVAEVHFASPGDDHGAYVVELIDGQAEIPNILLTMAGTINVYIYPADRTVFATTLWVMAREKPDDYVYTETEVLDWRRLDEKIGDLANLTTTAKENLVAAINEAAQSGSGTDISLGVTGASVGDIIKVKAVDASGKPTAWEAATAKLANPNALTFTGAVTGSYDGSAPLSVEIPSGEGTGGGGEKWVKIADYTWTEEDAAETNPPYLIYSTDADGNALAIDALYISCDAKTSANRTLYGKLTDASNNNNYTIKAENMFVNNQKLIVYNELKKLPSPHSIGYAANGPVGSNGGAAAKYYIKHFDNESLFQYPATGITIFPNSQIIAGSTFSIWGRVANV